MDEAPVGRGKVKVESQKSKVESLLGAAGLSSVSAAVWQPKAVNKTTWQESTYIYRFARHDARIVRFSPLRLYLCAADT